MPFYEYQCQACQYYAEVMQKITDPPLKKCPSCGKMTLVKLISAPVFRLKGSGWYETDFKSEKEGKRNLAEREATKPAEAPASAASGKAEASPPESKSAAPAAPAAPAKTRAQAKRRPGAPTARMAAKPAARASAARARAKTVPARRAAKGRSKR